MAQCLGVIEVAAACLKRGKIGIEFRPLWIQRDGPAIRIAGFVELVALAQRVTHDAPMERFPENCVINEYIPPLGIGAHRDYGAFGPTVACVSLGSDIVLDLSHPGRAVRVVPVLVPARSLWVLTGEARSNWLHGIARRWNDLVDGRRQPRQRRISITFRTARVTIS